MPRKPLPGLMAIVMMTAPGLAAPQQQQPAGASGFLCESDNARLRRCPLPAPGRAVLKRQLSGTACIEGRSWGNESGGVWVDLGCRAEFAVAAEGDGYDRHVVRCESRHTRWHRCPADTRGGVELVRQLSDNACIREQSWGWNKNGIWVSAGCRADFSLGAVADADAGRRMVRCESEDNRTQHCRVDTGNRVRLVRRLSSAPCEYDRDWGYERNEIWVSRGCRADFDVGPGGDDDATQVAAGEGEGNTDAGRRLTCESSGNHMQRCEVAISRGVELVHQISDDRCVEGRSWGWDRAGIWVSEGCRAEFRAW